MPNWAVGDLKVRGTADNLRAFLNTITPENSYWIEGTRRTFASQESVREARDWLEWGDFDDGRGVIILEDVQTAWGFAKNENIAQFENVSKKFQVDFRTTVWEMGMQFRQELEIINGKCTKLKTFTYDDWYWESERPNTGG